MNHAEVVHLALTPALGNLLAQIRYIFNCRRAKVECNPAECCRASCSFFSVVQDELLQDKPLLTSCPCPRFLSPTTRLPRICDEALAIGTTVRPLWFASLLASGLFRFSSWYSLPVFVIRVHGAPRISPMAQKAIALLQTWQRT